MNYLDSCKKMHKGVEQLLFVHQIDEVGAELQCP